jgi:hypothetical protein
LGERGSIYSWTYEFKRLENVLINWGTTLESAINDLKMECGRVNLVSMGNFDKVVKPRRDCAEVEMKME